MYYKKKYILFIFFLLSIIETNCQYYSKNSIKSGIGVGRSSSYITDAFGYAFSIGLQHEIWKDRLRINPDLNIGFYNSQKIKGVNNQYFNSINLEVKLNFDIIKYRTFSIIVGSGIFGNNTTGMTDFQIDTGSGSQDFPNSEYISNLFYGGCFGCGLRINPKKAKMAIIIMPLNISIGNNQFKETNTKIELDFRLK